MKRPLIGIIIVVTFLAYLQPIEGLCFEIVSQYYKCQHLKMIPLDKIYVFWFGIEPSYVPDYSVENNSLPDSFYKNLSNLTYDQGMALIQQIYLQTDQNCTSEFCECVRLGRIDSYLSGNNSIFFRNATNYPQVKSIIQDFGKKFQDNLEPVEYIHSLINYEEHELLTLAQFCINLEFTTLRIDFYKNTYDCDYYNRTLFDSCMWSVTVVDRKLVTNPSQLTLEREMVCYLQFIKSCPVEQQRFMAMAYWAEHLSSLKWSGKSLAAYFDRLMRNASAYSSDFVLSENSISIDRGFIYTIFSYRNNPKSSTAKPNATNSSLVLFRSPLLSITGQVNLVSKDTYRFTRYTILVSLTSSVPKQPSYNFTVNSSQRTRNNGLIVSDQKGAGVLHFVQEKDNHLEIYDFNSNSHIWLYVSKTILASPVQLWQNATGVLALGFNQTRVSPSANANLMKNFITLNVQMGV